MRTQLTAFAAATLAATSLAATPALAHPGHVDIPGTLHAIAHEVGGLDLILAVAALAVAGGVLVARMRHSARARNRRD
jgi:urease accessory protein